MRVCISLLRSVNIALQKVVMPAVTSAVVSVVTSTIVSVVMSAVVSVVTLPICLMNSEIKARAVAVVQGVDFLPNLEHSLRSDLVTCEHL